MQHLKNCRCYDCAPLNHTKIYRGHLVRYFCQLCKEDLDDIHRVRPHHELRNGKKYRSTDTEYCINCAAQVNGSIMEELSRLPAHAYHHYTIF